MPDSSWWAQVARERDEALRGATCPVCDRDIGWNQLTKDIEGRAIFVFHYDRRTGEECRASRRPMAYAQMIRERIDSNTGKTK